MQGSHQVDLLLNFENVPESINACLGHLQRSKEKQATSQQA